MENRLDYDEAVTIAINPLPLSLSLSMSSWNIFVQNLWQLFTVCRNEFMDSFGKFVQTPTQQILMVTCFGFRGNAGSKLS